MNQNIENDETEIRLDDLILFVLSHMRNIIAGIVAFAIIIGGIGTLSMALNTDDGIYTDEEKQEKAAVIAENFEAKRILELNQIVEKYNEYEKLAQQEEYYYQNSEITKIDPTNVVKLELQYNFDSTSVNLINVAEQTKNLQMILKNIETDLNNDDVYKSASEKLGTDESFIRELVTAVDYVPFYSNVYVSSGSEYTDQQATASGILTIDIKGSTEDYVKTIAEAIKSHIDSLEGEGSLFKGTLATESISVGYDADMVTRSSNIFTQIQTLRTNEENLLKNLTSDEQEYVDYLTLKKDADKQEPAKIGIQPMGVVKWSVIGAFLGACFVAFFWIIKYIMATNLISVYGIEDRFGIKTLARRSEDYKIQKGLAGSFARYRTRRVHFYDQDELIRVIKADILSVKHLKDIKQVFITSTGFTSDDIKIIEGIKNAMEESGVKICCGEKAIYDPEMITDISASDGVIILEHVGTSSNFEIGEEIKFAAEKKLEVLSAVVTA
ncbi:MAG: hypothetical protein K6F39_06025 [Lachnospiraceae bacterium]|nr:hypothetical protein [Lachnospiraceae bacterium]